MGMGIDAAWHHILATGIEDLGAGWRIQLVADRFDDAIGAIDIGALHFIGSDDGAASEQ